MRQIVLYSAWKVMSESSLTAHEVFRAVIVLHVQERKPEASDLGGWGCVQEQVVT
jgi:hypothetical protein